MLRGAVYHSGSLPHPTPPQPGNTEMTPLWLWGMTYLDLKNGSMVGAELALRGPQASPAVSEESPRRSRAVRASSRQGRRQLTPTAGVHVGVRRARLTSLPAYLEKMPHGLGPKPGSDGTSLQRGSATGTCELLLCAPDCLCVCDMCVCPCVCVRPSWVCVCVSAGMCVSVCVGGACVSPVSVR